jgi:hypothetical protein
MILLLKEDSTIGTCAYSVKAIIFDEAKENT